MTDSEIDEFMDLMRIYRTQGSQPEDQRRRFKAKEKRDAY